MREIIGGSLRPSDPRRFLIEAMVGAMHADGSVDDREMAALQGLLQRHELFAALPQTQATMLIELGRDAISFAGGAVHRVGTIAAALPARTQRLAAYAMACEVCAADDVIDPAELNYLEALRGAMRITEREHDEMLSAARDNRAMHVLDAMAHKIHELIPLLVDMFVLRKLSVAPLTESDCRQICSIMENLPDLGLLPEEIETQVRRAFQTYARWEPLDVEVYHLAHDLRQYEDRYWFTVYLMVSEHARGCTNWREVLFLTRLCKAFELTELDMEYAWHNASLFDAAH